ncbi:MAG: hypothetical protein ACTSUF_02105 [Candidatus Heimdallarchaeaceae archaeon]
MTYVDDILDQVGETITVQIKSESLDNMGHATETLVTSGTTTAVLQVMSQDDEEVKAGIMERGDLQIFFSPSDTYANYFNLDSYNIYIVWNNKTFKVYNIIKESGIESGHYELHAKRI